MGIKIGDVDVGSQIIENEYRIAVLERVVDRLLQNITPAFSPPLVMPDELIKIRESVIDLLNKKYPNSGIALKEGE